MDFIYKVESDKRTKTFDNYEDALNFVNPYLPWTISILDAQTNDEIASYDEMDAFAEFRTYLCNAVKDM